MTLKIKYPLEHAVTSEELFLFIMYLFIYCRITGFSHRLSRNFYSKHLSTAGPASSDQDAQDCVHSSVANAQGVPLSIKLFLMPSLDPSFHPRPFVPWLLLMQHSGGPGCLTCSRMGIPSPG